MSELKDNNTEAKAKRKILFLISGSIAAYKSCTVISRLVQNSFDVQVVATRSALEFVGAATLEGLSGRPVHSETFEAGSYMQHIHLMKWADLIILCPASANTIGKLASGMGDDLLTTLFLAYDFKKPFLLAPAMNTQMYLHPATQSSLERLKTWGVEVLETAAGVLACGDVGAGRLIEPDLIYQEIEKHLGKGIPSPTLEKSCKLKVLITSGGTREPIDSVRSITNTSTGETGRILADYLSEQGHDVTFLYAHGSKQPATAHQLIEYTTFADLQKSLLSLLKKNAFDALIHLAAVSDYSIEQIKMNGGWQNPDPTHKINSGEAIEIRLKQNPKIIDQVRTHSRNPHLLLVGFKLTRSDSTDKIVSQVASLVSHAQADFVVHNDLSQIDVSKGRHEATIYQGNRAVEHTHSKPQLAKALEGLLKDNWQKNWQEKRAEETL
jgi:phosphopantothenoylcysteine decarboxylase/phosphopantothenate--cysteine ligase